MYGQPVDMVPILELARPRHITVIEDAAHAPGAIYHGKLAGNLGDMGCFSFHEQKNMSTLGEGGMVTTNEPQLYERIRLYKSHCTRVIGTSTKYLTLPREISQKALARGEFWYQDFDDCGYNFRMNDVTATVGICQLKKLGGLNTRRQQIAEFLTNALTKIPGIHTPPTIENTSNVFHLYPILLDPKLSPITRNDFIFKLRMQYGIKCGVHYMPLVQTTAFKNRGYSEKNTPKACRLWPQLVTLPIHPRLTDEALTYLVDSIRTIMVS
jgi:dTDP-4-amino-4,6-dideoxygalactose transaminase